MPKQGQFARRQHQKKIKALRQRHSTSGQQRVISEEMANDFIIVRYRLTSGKQLVPLVRETGQRFLQELLPRLLKNEFDLQGSVEETIEYVNSRVPWQFFLQVSQSWSVLERFLERELPVLPINRSVILKNHVSKGWLDHQLGQLLAKKIAGITLLNRPAPSTFQERLTQKLVMTIMDQKQINWSAVEGLLKPLPFPIADDLDEGTQNWLRALQQIHG